MNIFSEENYAHKQRDITEFVYFYLCLEHYRAIICKWRRLNISMREHKL